MSFAIPVPSARTRGAVFVRREQDSESQTHQNQRPVTQQVSEVRNIEPHREDIPNVREHYGKEPQVAQPEMGIAKLD
jgi:hypothetical protein